MKKVLILGSTGSIGRQTLDVIRQQKDFFQVVGLACGKNISLIKEQIREFQPQSIAVSDVSLKDELKIYQKKIKIFYGEEGLLDLIRNTVGDVVVVAIAGAAGLKPAITAVRSGKNIALATKEVMVLAGEIINEELRSKNYELRKKGKPEIKLFPIDSEHSAIWQSLHAGSKNEIEKIILTCSGGPFRGKKRKDLAKVTVSQALAHPNWKMGKRITIDSATLMNKGLELIEAKWLFDLPIEKIEVVIHPQSILHSAVLFHDGSIIGQLGLPDMRVPIQYALSYPQRLKNDFPRLSFSDLVALTFEKPDMKTFRCLSLAYKAAEVGGTMPTVLNAADEVAVELFLQNKIRFLEMEKIIEKTMVKHTVIKRPKLSQILEADHWARGYARMVYKKLSD